MKLKHTCSLEGKLWPIQLPFLPTHSWCSCLDTSIASWLLLFSRSVVSNSLRPRGLQHSRSPCVSPSPGVHPSSWLLNWWCYPTLSSAALFFCLQSFPASGSFPISQHFHIRWPKDWSFSFGLSPTNEYSGLISFRIDWFELFTVQETSRVFSSTAIQKP